MTLYLYAPFTASKAGISTLADVTIDIDRINKSTGAVDALVTGAVVTNTGNLSPLRNGIYRYAIANVDVWTYDYLGTFKTADTTVDLQNVPSLRHEYVDTLNVSSGKVLLQDAQIDTLATEANQTTIINAVNAIDAGSGTGAFFVAVTVNDGTNALENATVRLTEGANTFTATTDADGIANFSLDGATYAITITKDGYQFTPATIVVDATHLAFTESMTAVVIPSLADAETAVIYVDTRTESGEVNNIDVTVTLMEDAPLVVSGSYECSFKQSKKSGVADADFPDLTPTSGRVYFKVYPSMSYKFECYACGYSDAQGNAKIVTSPAAGEVANLSTL